MIDNQRRFALLSALLILELLDAGSLLAMQDLVRKLFHLLYSNRIKPLVNVYVSTRPRKLPAVLATI